MGDGDEEEEAEKWVNHSYSSSHQILLVGDGDFSFSLSLAVAFGSAFNIVATSLDSHDTLMKKYKSAKSNLDQLVQLGGSLIHGLNATEMKFHTDLKMRKFDRIVYNFPHAGFHGKEDDLRLIKKHRRLVDGFFHNARGMLRPDGEIHVRHKTSRPFCRWNVEELASRNSLSLLDCVPFKIKDYPGYKNKRGDGSRSDEPFHLGECSTFKFILSGAHKKVLSNHIPSREDHRHSYKSDRVSAECVWMFDWYFDHVRENFGFFEDRIVHNVHEAIDRGYERFVNMDRGKPSSDFIVHLEELYCLSLIRIQWLEQNLAARSCYYY